LDAKVFGGKGFCAGQRFCIESNRRFYRTTTLLSKRRLAIVKRGFFLAFKIKLSPEDFIKASVVT
jgi:hypothetical protein